MNKNNSLSVLGALLILPVPLLIFVSFWGLLITGTDRGISISANQTHVARLSTESALVQQQSTSVARELQQSTTRTGEDTQATHTNKEVSFSQDVLPIFQSRCVYCHGPNSIAGAPPNGLQLDSYENVMLGSLFLPVINPGAPDKSTIILLLRSGGMPAQSTPLSVDQIDLIARWIAAGAPDN